MKKCLYILPLWAMMLALNLQLSAQERYAIYGTVHSADGEPLPGAAVFIHELNKGTTTDRDGEYRLENFKRGTYHLHVEFIGYEPQAHDVVVAGSEVEENFVMQPSSLELPGVVVEESALKTERKEMSQNIEVADEEALEKHAGTSLGRTLDMLPGVNSISTGTSVSKPVIRGLSFNRVVVTENGIKQEGQQWGADHGLEIDQFNVEQVEVIKGPAALMYGSDAIGGIVKIKPPKAPENDKIVASVMGIGRSNNQLVGSSSMIGINRKGKFLRLRYSTQDFADFRVPADTFEYNNYLLPIYNERLKNTAGRERNFNAVAGLSGHWGYSNISVSNYFTEVGFFAGAHGVPRANELTDDGDPRNIGLPKQVVHHLKVISNSNFSVGKNWLEVDLGYQRNDREEHSLPHTHGLGPLPDDNLELALLLHTYSANLRYHHDISERYSQVYGFNGQFQQHEIGGFNFLVPEYQNYNGGIFTYHKYQPRRNITLNGGLRADYGNVQIQQYQRPVYADPETISDYELVNPDINREFYNLSGGAGVSWFPHANINLKLNLGSSYKIPTVPELASNGIHHGAFRHEMGDSSLTSERGYQLDLGFSYQRDDLFFSVSPYYYYFPNFIFLNPSAQFSPLSAGGQIYQYEQAEAINTGAETSIDYHLTKALHLGLNAEYVYALNLNNSYSLPFIPPASVLADVEYEFEQIAKVFHETWLMLSWRGTAAQNNVARNEPRTPAYQLWNFALGSTIKINEQPVKLRFRIDNIFDVKYFAHLNQYRRLNLPEPGRNFTLSVVLPLEFKIKSNHE